MTTLKEMAREVVAARRAIVHARQSLERLASTERDLSRGLAEASALAEVHTLSVAELEARVADMARSHGAECGANGGASTTDSWVAFRIYLGELTKRAAR